ncbi:hypothetical protein OHS59_24155 [Streptomyces sp. NBC_00414]|uniref:hypothetical protein n=1 Tax=Streptomyces sp. NBC_00414 TaxID=2975739 RepID=UPI002E1F7AED
MGDPGGGRGADAERVAEGVAEGVGELLGVLAEKVRVAGPDAVRVLTEEELQQHQLSWFRAGWEEHARASGQEHAVGPDRPPEPPSERPSDRPSARLLPFPERPRGHEHPSDDGG